jgi:hypothetical protein
MDASVDMAGIDYFVPSWIDSPAFSMSLPKP